MIKKFKEFVKEAYTSQQTDPPEVASQINYFNNKEQMVRDFELYKNDLINIYMNYSDESDLINKLASKKIIEKKTQNKKEIKFKNELLAIWAQSCSKRRDLKNIEDSIKSSEGDIKTRQENIKNNPGLEESEGEVIENTKLKISDNKTKISVLQKEILDLEREAKLKLDSIKKDLNSSKIKIDNLRAKKTMSASQK